MHVCVSPEIFSHPRYADHCIWLTLLAYTRVKSKCETHTIVLFFFIPNENRKCILLAIIYSLNDPLSKCLSFKMNITFHIFTWHQIRVGLGGIMEWKSTLKSKQKLNQSLETAERKVRVLKHSVLRTMHYDVSVPQFSLS